MNFRALRCGAILLGARGIDEQPQQSAQCRKRGREIKSGIPAETCRQPRGERRGDRAADLAGHVHYAGCHSGVRARDISADGPVRALRQVHRADSSGKDENRSGRTARVRAHDQEYGGESERENSEAGTADSESVAFAQAVAEYTAGNAEHSHGDEGEHRIERARLEVETARLGEVDEEPAQEDPCNVAEGEATEAEGGYVTVEHSGAPGERSAGFAQGGCGARGLDKHEFLARDAWVLFGQIAGGPIPNETSDDASDCAHPEGRTPAVLHVDPVEKGHAQSGA